MKRLLFLFSIALPAFGVTCPSYCFATLPFTAATASIASSTFGSTTSFSVVGWIHNFNFNQTTNNVNPISSYGGFGVSNQGYSVGDLIFLNSPDTLTNGTGNFSIGPPSGGWTVDMTFIIIRNTIANTETLAIFDVPSGALLGTHSDTIAITATGTTIINAGSIIQSISAAGGSIGFLRAYSGLGSSTVPPSIAPPSSLINYLADYEFSVANGNDAVNPSVQNFTGLSVFTVKSVFPPSCTIAGPYTTPLGSSTTPVGTGIPLNGGTAISYMWNNIAGPTTPTITGGTTPTPTISNLNSATNVSTTTTDYIIQLSCTDSTPQTTPAQVHIGVVPINSKGVVTNILSTIQSISGSQTIANNQTISPNAWPTDALQATWSAKFGVAQGTVVPYFAGSSGLPISIRWNWDNAHGFSYAPGTVTVANGGVAVAGNGSTTFTSTFCGGGLLAVNSAAFVAPYIDTNWSWNPTGYRYSNVSACVGTLVNTNFGGSSNAVVTATTSGGAVTGINIISGGSGYTTGSYSTTFIGAGTGGSVTLIVSGGAVTSSSSIVGGSGYTGNGTQDDHNLILAGNATWSGASISNSNYTSWSNVDFGGWNKGNNTGYSNYYYNLAMGMWNIFVKTGLISHLNYFRFLIDADFYSPVTDRFTTCDVVTNGCGYPPRTRITQGQYLRALDEDAVAGTPFNSKRWQYLWLMVSQISMYNELELTCSNFTFIYPWTGTLPCTGAAIPLADLREESYEVGEISLCAQLDTSNTPAAPSPYSSHQAFCRAYLDAIIKYRWLPLQGSDGNWAIATGNPNGVNNNVSFDTHGTHISGMGTLNAITTGTNSITCSGACWNQAAFQSTVFGIVSASPLEIAMTSPMPGMAPGSTITITGATNCSALNGSWTVSRVDFTQNLFGSQPNGSAYFYLVMTSNLGATCPTYITNAYYQGPVGFWSCPIASITGSATLAANVIDRINCDSQWYSATYVSSTQISITPNYSGTTYLTGREWQLAQVQGGFQTQPFMEGLALQNLSLAYQALLTYDPTLAAQLLTALQKSATWLTTIGYPQNIVFNGTASSGTTKGMWYVVGGFACNPDGSGPSSFNPYDFNGICTAWNTDQQAREVIPETFFGLTDVYNTAPIPGMLNTLTQLYGHVFAGGPTSDAPGTCSTAAGCSDNFGTDTFFYNNTYNAKWCGVWCGQGNTETFLPIYAQSLVSSGVGVSSPAVTGSGVRDEALYRALRRELRRIVEFQ